MYSYCLGIRLNSNYQELACAYREKCAYYTNTNLSEAFANPDSFEELDTYNDKECNLWQQDNRH